MGYISYSNSTRLTPIFTVLGSILHFFKKIVYTTCSTQPNCMLQLQKQSFWKSEIRLSKSSLNLSSNFLLINFFESKYKFAANISKYIEHKGICNKTVFDDFKSKKMMPVKQEFCYFWISCKTVPENFNQIMANINYDKGSEDSNNIMEFMNQNHTTDEAFCRYGDESSYYPCNSNRFVSECSEDSFICFIDSSCDFDDDDSADELTTSKPISTEVPKNSPSLDDGRKVKKVRFDLNPQVHTMHAWDYAYRAARKGDWEMYARDRQRFQQRIARTEVYLNPILDASHRQKIYLNRFSEGSVT